MAATRLFPLDRQRIENEPAWRDRMLEFAAKRPITEVSNSRHFLPVFLAAEYWSEFEPAWAEKGFTRVLDIAPALVKRLEVGKCDENAKRENGADFATMLNYLICWIEEGRFAVNHTAIALALADTMKELLLGRWYLPQLADPKKLLARDTDETVNLYLFAAVLEWGTAGSEWEVKTLNDPIVGGIVSHADVTQPYREMAQAMNGASLRDRIDLICACSKGGAYVTETDYSENEVVSIARLARLAKRMGHAAEFSRVIDFVHEYCARFPHLLTYDGKQVLDRGDVKNPRKLTLVRIERLVTLRAFVDDFAASREPLFEVPTGIDPHPRWFLVSRNFMDRDPLAHDERGGEWFFGEGAGVFVAHSKNATLHVPVNRQLPFHHVGGESGIEVYADGEWIMKSAVGYFDEAKKGSAPDSDSAAGITVAGITPNVERFIPCAAWEDHGDGWKAARVEFICGGPVYPEHVKNQPIPFLYKWRRNLLWVVSPEGSSALVVKDAVMVGQWDPTQVAKYTKEDQARIAAAGDPGVVQIVRAATAPTRGEDGGWTWSTERSVARLFSFAPFFDLFHDDNILGDARIPESERGWQLRKKVRPDHDGALQMAYAIEVCPRDQNPLVELYSLIMDSLFLRGGRSVSGLRSNWGPLLERTE